MPDKLLRVDDHSLFRQNIDHGADPDCQSLLTDLAKAYRQELPERLNMVERLIPQAVAGCQDALDKIILEAHNMRGTATTFGLPRLSVAMADVEHLLGTASMEHLTFRDSAAWLCVDKALWVAKSAISGGAEPEVRSQESLNCNGPKVQ